MRAKIQDRYVPENLLVTGGAGFIGANFIHYLAGHYPELKIINLDNLTYAGSKERLNGLANASNHCLIEGDIGDAELLTQLLNDFSIDTIVHFAAESHVDRSIQDPEIFVKTNVLGTSNLLHCAKLYWLAHHDLAPDKCRFHHISTDEVYGSLGAGEPAFTEQHAYAPNSPYSASKASADHLVRAYAHTFGLPITISNCSNNYGPGQHREKFIPTIIDACLNRRSIPIYGTGSNIRDWLYVDDHCAAIDTVIRRGKPGETYNIGGDNEQSNIQIAEMICALFDRFLPNEHSYVLLISFVPDRLGHDWRYAINNDKIKNELRWEAKERFEAGLMKTIKFYRQP